MILGIAEIFAVLLSSQATFQQSIVPQAELTSCVLSACALSGTATVAPRVGTQIINQIINGWLMDQLLIKKQNLLSLKPESHN